MGTYARDGRLLLDDDDDEDDEDDDDDDDEDDVVNSELATERIEDNTPLGALDTTGGCTVTVTVGRGVGGGR